MSPSRLDAADRELRNETLLAILEYAVQQGEEPARDGDPTATRALFGLIVGGGALFVVGLLLWGAWGGQWVLLSLSAALLIGISWSLHRAVEKVSPAPLWSPNEESENATLPLTARSNLLNWGDQEFWFAQQPLRSPTGAMVGSRMGVMRANEAGHLLIYNPIALPAPLRRTLEGHGQVRWIVCPNANHHRFIGEWTAAFPEAELWAAPKLAARRNDIAWTGILGRQGTSTPWDEDLVTAQILEGLPAPEVVIFHRASSTLLVTDAIVNMGHHKDTPMGVAAMLELFGMRKRPGPPVTMKWTVTRRTSLQRSVQNVLGWPFQRIFLTHGHLIDHDAKRVWRDGFAFVLDEDS